MKKNTYSIRAAYLVATVIIILMMFLQLILITVNNIQEAKNTTRAHLRQVESIVENNTQQEEALVDALKNDYIVIAKAVSYYLDHNESAVNNEKELQKICSLMSIDEIHIFNEKGVITSSTNPKYKGLSFDSGDQISFFKPMLSDRTMSMCQDMIPNTADNRPMMYAITWNEAKTRMVQVGIEPVRLMHELKLNEMQLLINNITIDKHMSIIIADASSLDVIASTETIHRDKNFKDICNIDLTKIKKTSNIKNSKLKSINGHNYCYVSLNDNYYICVFLNYNYFVNRTLESLIIVLVYLIVALFVIMLVIRRLNNTRQENIQHLEVFESMSEIYYSLHLVDLKKNSVVEYSAKNQVKDSFMSSGKVKADELMIKIMHATMSDEYLDIGLKFSDITTLRERMKDKKLISMELLGKNVGWIRMSFITISEENGYPKKIIIATQIIDEEKKRADILYEKSHIDELTKCHNRTAYNEDIEQFVNSPDDVNYAYISFDLNGLKTVNDSLGHEAGDELICGAAECMKGAFIHHGKVYRVGGDEFAALLFVDSDFMKVLCEDFENKLKNWHGKIVDSVSVSYGYVLSDEIEDKSMVEISNLADKRMYEAKERYYKEKGIERRRT